MNKAKIAAVFLVLTIFTGVYAQALDGRAAVAANGVFPIGDYGKATGFLPGDTVVVELSPYDLTHGRIVYNKK